MSVGFGSAFYFQGIQHVVMELSRAICIERARTTARYVGEDEAKVVGEMEAFLNKQGKISITNLISDDVVQSIPIVSQIVGISNLLGAIACLSEEERPEWKSVHKALILRNILVICNLSPLLLITDSIASIGVAIIHNGLTPVPAT